MLLKKNGLKVLGFSGLAVVAGFTAIASPQINGAHAKEASKKSFVIPAVASTVKIPQGNLLASLTKQTAAPMTQSDKISRAKGREELLRHEAKFLENKGQWDHRASYMARTPGMDMWLEDRGIDFDYYRTRGTSARPGRVGDAVHMSFAGGKQHVSYIGRNDTGSRTDFMLGKIRALDVHAYRDVYAKSIYPGIDLHTHFDNLKPRYDLIVAPGSSVSQLKLQFDGASKVSATDKSIVLQTTIGQEAQDSLVAYQQFGATRKTVDAKFVRLDAHTVGVKVGNYDRTRDLIVDPLVYGSYYGGDDGFDEVRGIVEDGAGGTYLTGDTQSFFFPAIFGPYGNYNLIGVQNVFLSKLQGDAYNHDYAAFIGGHGVDVGQYIKIDPKGNIWVAGTTTSADFPSGSSENTSPVPTYFIGIPFQSDAVKGVSKDGNLAISNGQFQILYGGGITTGPIQSNVTSGQLRTILNSTIGASLGISGQINVTQLGGAGISTGGVYEIQLPNSPNAQLPLSTVCTPFGASEGLSTDYVAGPLFVGQTSATCAVQRNGTDPFPGSTFTITVVDSKGTSATTKPIPYDATSDVIQTAVLALGNVGTGNATVTGTGGVDKYHNPMTITFGPKMAAFPPTFVSVSNTYAGTANNGIYPNNALYTIRQSSWKFLLPFGLVNGIPVPRSSGALVIDGPLASQESAGFQQANPDWQGNYGWLYQSNIPNSPSGRPFAPGTPSELFEGFDVRQELASDGSVDIILTGSNSAPLAELAGVATPPGRINGYMVRYKYTGTPIDSSGGNNSPDSLTLNASASSYIGSGNADNAGVVLDLAGNAYLTGTVYNGENTPCGPNSPVFVTGTSLNTGSPGASWQNGTNGDLLKFDDIYVRQYSNTGALVWSGLLGGHADDNAGGVDVEADGTVIATGSCVAIDQENASSNAAPSVYITGTSRSFDYPRTRGVFGGTFTDSDNAIVTKVNNTGTTVLYSTNLQESENFGSPMSPFNNLVLPAGIAIDARGQAYVTGNMHFSLAFPEDNTPPPMTLGTPDEPNGVNYPSMPKTTGAFSTTWSTPGPPTLPTTEPFVEALSFDATQLVFGSYLGGDLDDRVYAPYVDSIGDAWLFGWTDSGRQYFVPTTPNATERQVVGQQLPGSMIDGLAFKKYNDSAGNGPQMGSGSATEVDQVAYGLLNYQGYSAIGNPAGAPGFPAPFPFQLTLPFPGMGPTLYARDGWLVRVRVGSPSVQTLTLNPTTIPGGGSVTSTGTVTLTLPAPAGGATITVTLTDANGNPSTSASFSPTTESNSEQIVIAAGSTTQTFTVYGEPVISPTPVTVEASYQETFAKAVLTVTPWLQQFTLSPSTVVGGNPVTGTIILTANAPAGGLPITITSDNAAIATQSFTVPTGSSNFQFSIATAGVISPIVVNLTASVTGGGYSITQQLTIIPPGVVPTLSFNPSSIAVGSTSTGTLTLTGQVGSDTPVTLSSDVTGVSFTDTSGNPITSSNPLIIPKGASSVQFIAVTVSNITAPQTTITAQATINGSSQTATGVLSFTNFGLTGYSSFTPTPIDGGSSSTSTLTISQPAPPGGVAVNLQILTPGVVVYGPEVTNVQTNSLGQQTTGLVYIPQGANTATFTVIGSALANGGSSVVQASRATTVMTQSISVNPLQVSMSLSPSDVLGGGGTISAGQITIPQAVPQTLAFSVTTSPTLSVSTTSIPPYTIAIGNTTTVDGDGNIVPTFTITPPAVNSILTDTVTATWLDALQQTGTVSQTLTVEPVGLSSLTFRPDTIRQRTGTTGFQIVISGAAPAGGLTITLHQSGNFLQGLPSSVTIPAGQSSLPVSGFFGSYRAGSVSRTIADTITATDPFGGVATAVVVIER